MLTSCVSGAERAHNASTLWSPQRFSSRLCHGNRSVNSVRPVQRRVCPPAQRYPPPPLVQKVHNTHLRGVQRAEFPGGLIDRPRSGRSIARWTGRVSGSGAVLGPVPVPSDYCHRPETLKWALDAARGDVHCHRLAWPGHLYRLHGGGGRGWRGGGGVAVGGGGWGGTRIAASQIAVTHFAFSHFAVIIFVPFYINYMDRKKATTTKNAE